MIKLLIDVGNTSAKYCLLEQNSYQQVSFQHVLSRLSEVDSIAIASVAENNQVTEIIKQADKQNIAIVYAEVASSSYGVECAYDNYTNLGIDRWLAILAAEQLYPKRNLVIVDAGTATTIDFLAKDKKHLGGWIAPGLDLMQASIIEKAPGVFGEKLAKVEKFANDTPAALASGCFYSCLGMINTAVDFFNEQTDGNILLLLTGGNGKQLSDHITIEHELNSNLVFVGLSRFLTPENS